MFKRLLLIFVCLALVLSLTACSISFKLPVIQNESAPNSQNTTTNNSSDISGGNTNQKPNGSSSTPAPKPKPNQNTQSSISSPTIEAPALPNTNHTPVLKEKYYQYASLTQTEKNIYNDICAAIEATQNVINLSKYHIDYNKMWGIYQKVIADNPQYFWVSKFIEYTHLNQNGKDTIIDLILYYTDGEITDNIKNNKLTTVASRDKINAQINQVNLWVEAMLATIPSSYTDIEKEYLIHNLIVNSVTYDHSAVGQELSRTNYSRIYDIYGAAINKKAVCEGYSRLFQYLCYQVGINSAIIHGTSENQAHAWNAVRLNGNWYHVDLTWNDGMDGDIPLYDYFNLTTEEICFDHIIEEEELAVPTANSTEYSFTNTFGMKLERLMGAPLNYQNAIDYAVKFNTPYLYVMVNMQNTNHGLSNYLMGYFFNSNSEVQRYIKSKGYNLRFDESKITYTDTCIFIKRK